MLGLGSGINKLSSAEAAAIAARSGGYLLDTYSGAAVAYSLRQLSSEYSGSAVKVRRASDNVEADIGFSNGRLDISALSAHCGSSDGFISVWYDQSSNANNATQGTAANQPKIYNGSSVITVSGQPSISFDGINDRLSMDPGDGDTINYFNVVQKDVEDVWSYMRQYAGANFRGQLVSVSGGLYYSPVNRTPAGTVNSGVNIRYGSPVIHSFLVSPTVANTFANGSGNTSQLTNTPVVNNMQLTRDGNAYIEMYISEIVGYLSDQSSNRTGIEGNMNDFYSIY